ncbi:MAG: adenylate/guanylate cyclase domain-containing protein [Pseudohongiellaceae bacterium]
MSRASSTTASLNPLHMLLHLVPGRGRLVVLLAAALVSILLIKLFSGPLKTLEESLGALGWTLASDDNIEQRITLVAIDERSLEQIGPWPWARQDMARLVNAIDAAGAQLQIHDVYYSEAKPGDAELLAALQASRGAVLAQVPVLQPEQTLRVGTLSHALTGVNCNAGAGLPSAQGYIANHAGFASVAAGHILTNVASDGAVREFPALICVDGAAYPALSISGLLQATNNENSGASLSADTTLFGPALRLQLDAYPGLQIPLDAQGNLRISYKQSPDNFQAISAADVMAGNIEPGMLENTWVLVGATALSMGDIVPTPYSGATPGVELQMRILASLLDAQMPYTPRSANWALGLISLLFAALLWKLASASGRVSAYGLPVAAVVLPIAALSLHIQLLSSSEIWLGWLYPALYSVLAGGLLLLLEQSRGRVERGRVYENLSSYLPIEVAREIAYKLPNSAINAKRCDVTLLSADLRNFAAFGEARPPEESAAVLHFFFVRATEIIEQHGGRVHEFKGDSLLAVWDGYDRHAAEQALAAAEQMQGAIDQNMLSPEASIGLEPLALGIGIEQGPALIGSIGPAHRRSHSLLGDTVTITLRIQELTEELAQPILVGECAARQLSDLNLESQGSYLLKGLRIPHTLFSPAFKESPKQYSPRKPPQLKVVGAHDKA